jgi:hypothetical protein
VSIGADMSDRIEPARPVDKSDAEWRAELSPEQY